VALDAVLDGELVAFDHGVPSFQTLQQRMHLRNQKQVEQLSLRIPVVYMVFDLIYMDGRDLTGHPLQERRRLLEEAVVPSEQIQISPAVAGDGMALFEAAAAQGLEGIMAKRLSSLYLPGTRSRDWLKVKIKFDADVVIVDCLNLWVANLLHKSPDLSDVELERQAAELAAASSRPPFSLILVSNEVGWGVHPETALGRRFRDALGRVNQAAARAADDVILMVAGCPLVVKPSAADAPGPRRLA